MRKWRQWRWVWAGACLCAGLAVAQPLPLQLAAIPDAGPYGEAGDSGRDRLIDAVQRRYNARVVRVTEVVVNGRPAYEMRLLSDNRVWTVRVDAASGQVIQGSD